MLLKATLQARIYQVQYLLKEKKEDVNAVDIDGQTALMKTCFINSHLRKTAVRIARDLLRHGADISIKDNQGQTVLMLACKEGKSELVKLVLDSAEDRLNINEKDKLGNNSLIHAVRNGDSEIVRYLTFKMAKHNLDIDQENNAGLTPLRIAKDQFNFQNLEILLKAGARPRTVEEREISRKLIYDEFETGRQRVRKVHFRSKSEPIVINPIRSISEPKEALNKRLRRPSATFSTADAKHFPQDSLVTFQKLFELYSAQSSTSFRKGSVNFDSVCCCCGSVVCSGRSSMTCARSIRSTKSNLSTKGMDSPKRRAHCLVDERPASSASALNKTVPNAINDGDLTGRVSPASRARSPFVTSQVRPSGILKQKTSRTELAPIIRVSDDLSADSMLR